MERSQRFRRAFKNAARERFLPHEARAHAHVDRPLRLGFGQTNSQPSTVAAMLALLDVPEGARVLDVGAGSGWTTALLAELVGEHGRVYGVERITELAENAARAVAPWPQACVDVPEPGVLGAPDLAPFDRILVSAEAERDVPKDLVAQLRPGGIMVIPVAGEMLRVTRGETVREPRVTKHGAYVFVPLVVNSS